MKRVLHALSVLTPLLSVATPSWAQSIADQIAAVDLAQSRQRAAEQAALAAREQEARRIEQRQQAEIVEIRRARLEAQAQTAIAARVSAEEAAEEARQKAADAANDKKRDQTYDDKLRDLDLEAKTLQIDAMKTRVSRENDYIDRDLQRRGAETDVIQSRADEKRNLSVGMETLLERTGEAEVRGASRTTTTTVLDPSSGMAAQQISR